MPTENPQLTTATESLPTVTPTLPPLAARVNGGYILLEDYQAELKRLQDAELKLGIQLSAEERKQKALDELIGEELLAQAAFQKGFQFDDEAIQAEIEKLKAAAGNTEGLAAWMEKNGYGEESLKRALRRAKAAAWQREKILADLPAAVEQVHACQILAGTEEQANQIINQLNAGADFATLSKKYDPITGGDLGWFPRGYLTQPEIEMVAFSLQPGEYSQVIQTSFGFHILQVIEKDAQRELDPDARQVIQRQAVQKWIQDQKDQSKIEILEP